MRTLTLALATLVVVVATIAVAERYYGRLTPEEFWRRVAEAKVEVIM